MQWIENSKHIWAKQRQSSLQNNVLHVTIQVLLKTNIYFETSNFYKTYLTFNLILSLDYICMTNQHYLSFCSFLIHETSIRIPPLPHNWTWREMGDCFFIWRDRRKKFKKKNACCVYVHATFTLNLGLRASHNNRIFNRKTLLFM